MSYRVGRQKESTVSVQGTLFILDSSYGYHDFKLLGKGSYGVVVSAICDKMKQKVAIKKITNVTKHIYDAKHVLREIRLMRYFGQHENIISLLDLYLRESQEELYIVMELMDSDLHHVIQSKQALTEAHIKHFMHQLCCGVKYLHDHRIIHRDLKPGNILVSKDCRLRITDFGLARERPVGDDKDNPDVDIDEPMTVHVVTRWYRAPELMLLPDGLYTYAVDVWSVGCILGEMLGRRPMFPGKTFIHQLSLIFDVLGAPSREDVAHITHPEAKQFLAQQTHKMRQSFRDLYPSSSSESLDLLAHLLVFNPYRRISMNDALTMDFLWNCGLQESRVFPPVSDKCEFSFEEASITRYQLKQLILDEVSTFRKEQAQAMAPPPPPSTAAAAPKPPLVRQGSQKVSPTKPKAVAEEKGSVDAKGGEDNKDTDGDARLPRYLQSTASHSSRLTQGEGGGSRRASSVQRRGVSATSSTAAAKRANDEVSTRPPAHMVRTSENEAKKPHNNLTVESRPAPPVDDVSRMFDLESILHRINLGDRYHSNLNGLPPSPSRTQPARPPLANSDELGSPSPPRSPLRPLVGASSPSKKSLLATYTSPRRLGNKVTEDLAGEETDDDKTPEVRRSHTLTHALRNPSFLPAAKREGEREASLSPAPTMRDVSEPNSPMRVLHPAVPKSSSGLGRVHTMETSSPQLKYTIEKHSYADLAPSSGDDEVPEGVPLERNASIRRDHSGSTGGTSIPEEPEEVVKESETKTSSPQRMIVRGPNTIHTMATHVVNGPQRHHFERELAVGMGARERCKEEDYKKDQDREHEEQRKKKEKKITRPISPKFSVMSWQRKQAQGVSAGEGRAVEGPRQDLKKRAISTSRMRPNRSEL